MADELEYHVTFPTKFSGSPRPRGAEAAAAVAEDVDMELAESRLQSEPVIFLLGWYAAEEKELAKYSAIYQSEGYITIRYVLPEEFIFGEKFGEIKDIAVKVLEAFFDLGLEENPIFFHLFSNGGGFIYRAITEILSGRSPGQFAALKIAGVIWDSAPCRPTFMAGLRAYSLFSPSMQMQPWYMAYIKTAPSWCLRLAKFIFNPRYWEAGRMLGSYMQAISDDKLPCPQLYIYSAGDCIVWYRDIQEIVQKRRERGLEIREAFFEDSDHLEHLAKHHEEYVDACLDLIQLCTDQFNKGDL